MKNLSIRSGKTPKKAKYRLVWDTEDCTDGYDVGNRKDFLVEAMKDHLVEWMMYFGDGGKVCTPDDWNNMINNCGCRCYRNADLTPDCDTDRIWSCHLSDQDLEDIGWVTTDEMDDDTYAEHAKMYGWPKRKKK